jgi:hypothetical protein
MLQHVCDRLLEHYPEQEAETSGIVGVDRSGDKIILAPG